MDRKIRLVTVSKNKEAYFDAEKVEDVYYDSHSVKVSLKGGFFSPIYISDYDMETTVKIING